MCSAAIYWVGIGTVVFALAETDLREMTGADVRNPTLALPCRDVFTAGSRPVNVHGPFELAEARDVHGEDSGTRRTRQRQNSLYGRVSHVTSTARYTRRTAGRSRRGDRPLAVTAYAVNSRGLIDMYADYVRPERSARRLLLA